MRSLTTALLLSALLVGPAMAGSPGTSGAAGDGATAPDKIFQSDDPTAGRVGSGTSTVCGRTGDAGGPCLSGGSVGQISAPLPPGLVVTGAPGSVPVSGQ